MGRTVSIKLLADVGGYMSGMGRAAVATREFSGELNKAASGGKAEQITRATAAIGIGMLGVAGAAIKFSMDFDKSMSAVKAATNDSSKSAAENTKNMTDLRAAALQAGKDTSFSATQAADGITELAKAGIKTADILHGGLKGALDLAAAGQISVAEASGTAASAMTQFKLSGSAVPHIADLLAAGAGKAQGSVHDMGYALAQSGLVASQFGLSIEDTTGTLAAFAHAGLIGSDAGTSFKTMLLALANPAGKTKETMDELGISAYDAQGKFVGITKLAEQLKTKLGGLTQAQRDAALAQIFGSDAIRAANVLYQEGGKGIQGWIGSVNDAGYASRTAATMTDNLTGDLERLKGSLETLAIESGSGANQGLRVLTKSLDNLVGSFISMPPAVGASLTVIAGIGGVMILALAAFVKLRRGLATTVIELEAMGPAGEKAAVGLQKTASAAGKASLVFIALETVTQVLQAFGRSAADVDKLTDSMNKFAETGKVTGEAADKFGKDLHGINDDAAVATNGVAKWADKVAGFVPVAGDAAKAAMGLGARIAGKDDYDTAIQNFTNLDQALTQYMTTTGDARKASDLWNEMLRKSGLDTEQLAKLMPNAYTEVGKLNQAQDDASRAGAKMGADGRVAADGTKAAGTAAAAAAEDTKKYTTAAQAAAGAARGQRAALKSLSDFMKAETDPVFGLIKAQDDLTTAQKNYSKAVKEHGSKSREAKTADREFALAAIALQGAVGDVTNGFNGKLSPALVNTLKKAGATKGELKNLEQQFKDAKKAADKYDGNYAANASAPGAKNAKKQLDDAYTAANHFDGPYRATVTVYGASEAEVKLRRLSIYQQALKSGKIPAGFNGPIKGPDGKYYADGGQVDGWSPHPRADNIPAWLTANEWVHPVDSVKYYGPQVMSAIQHRKVPREVLAGFATGQLGKMGDLPLGLAAGGPVVWRFLTTAAQTRIPSRAEVESKAGGGGQAGPFLHAQDGKPYVWASAGPGGYDCSGIVSAVYNLLHHRNPYQHTFSTASLPGSWFTKPGIGGQLTAAWSNPGQAPASSTTGHMMGMAGGLTFESTGSRGVHLGRTTRRLTDFAHVAHYGLGGPVEPRISMHNGGTITEPVMGVGASGRTYSFGENYMPERVTPGWNAGNSSGNTYVISPVFTGPVGSRAELANWLTGAIDDLKRRGRM